MKEVILNRIKKNIKKCKRIKSEAIRIYDRDIPEFPFIAEKLGENLVLWNKGDGRARDEEHWKIFQLALKELYPFYEFFYKSRQKQKGAKQYEKIALENKEIIVSENNLKFKLNLSNYLDTGLFLDHRPIREKIRRDSGGKKFLNLFSYTGSVSVYAASSGGITTSVDMSKTYLEWSKENFRLNAIDISKHQFINQNCMEFIKNNLKNYEFLIHHSMRVLNREGTLYFSTNHRDFKFSHHLKNKFKVQDLSKITIPIDFHDSKIHSCFSVRH